MHKSDDTHNYKRKDTRTNVMFETSELDFIRQIKKDLNVEKRRNRTIILFVGVIIFIVEILSITIKLIKNH